MIIPDCQSARVLTDIEKEAKQRDDREALKRIEELRKKSKALPFLDPSVLDDVLDGHLHLGIDDEEFMEDEDFDDDDFDDEMEAEESPPASLFKHHRITVAFVLRGTRKRY